jgi:beta-galactosidase
MTADRAAGSRRESLTAGWRFGGAVPHPGPEDRLDERVVAEWSTADLDDSGWEAIDLPHTVVPLSWEAWDDRAWEKVWAYRRTFTVDVAPGERVFLDFDGAVTSAIVTLNGVQVGRNRGGYLPFGFEITDVVVAGENRLAVILDARFNINVPPNAPDPVSSSAIDFFQPGGIDRAVWLRYEPAAFIGDVALTHRDVLDSARRTTSAVITIDAVDAVDDAALTIRVRAGDDIIAGTTSEPLRVPAGRSEHTVELGGLDRIRLWDVDDPALYQVEAVLTADGRDLHARSVRTGYREARFELDGFYLNGRRRYLMGANRHAYFPYAGFAMPDRVHRKDAEVLRRELNCLMVRCSHYPPSAAFLDACDELGLLVWEESPGWHFIGDTEWQEAALDQIERMVVRDRHRPSVVVWGARLNETPDNPDFYGRTEALVKRLDPTRATSGATNGEYFRSMTFQHDLFSYDDYTTRLEDGDRRPDLVEPVRDRPYLVSESVAARSSPTTHYRRTETAAVAQHQARDYAVAHDHARGDTSFSGLLAWLAFDYQSPRGNGRRGVRFTGLTDMFRVPKPGAALYRSQVAPTTRVVIEPAFAWDPPQFGNAHGYADRPETAEWGPGSEAIICSNCDRLEVYLGAELVGTVTPDRERFPHLEYPPSFVDLSLTGRDPELRIDGFVDGALVGSRRWSGDRTGDALELRADDQSLLADGSDATRVTIAVVDRYGNPRATALPTVSLEIDGPATLVGEPLVDLDRIGAIAAVWIRSQADRTGRVTIRAAAPGFGAGAAVVDMTPTRRSGVDERG